MVHPIPALASDGSNAAAVFARMEEVCSSADADQTTCRPTVQAGQTEALADTISGGKVTTVSFSASFSVRVNPQITYGDNIVLKRGSGGRKPTFFLKIPDLKNTFFRE